MEKLEKGESAPFSILKEDFDNSSREFNDDKNCPLAVAAKRQLGVKFDNGCGVGHFAINTENASYQLHDAFGYGKFLDISNGIEFHTTVKRVI